MAKKDKLRKRGRKERQFFPSSSTNPWLVRAVGAVGATLLGAGAYGQFLATPPPTDIPDANPLKGVPWILAGGAGLFALAIWIGTPGGAILRVGDGGIALDRATVRRIPWHKIDSIRFLDAKQLVRVQGKDETDAPLTIDAPLKGHGAAAARIIHDAKERIPAKIEITEDEAKALPELRDDDSLVLDMTALQVVGLRCAESDKIISYEPDARVCPRCERVYHKLHVPDVCACGAPLAALRAVGKKKA